MCLVNAPFGESYVTVGAIGPDELPPPYSASLSGGVPMVACRVCGSMIDVSGKRDQHVVKCDNCNEATVRITSTIASTITSKITSTFYLNLNCLYLKSPSKLLQMARNTFGVPVIVFLSVRQALKESHVLDLNGIYFLINNRLRHFYD